MKVSQHMITRMEFKQHLLREFDFFFILIFCIEKS